MENLKEKPQSMDISDYVSKFAVAWRTDMKNSALMVALIALAATAAGAQDRKEICEAIAPSMLQASDGIGEMASGLLTMDFSTVGAQIGGDEGTRFANLATLRDAMMPELQAFVAEFDAAALDLRSCAR